MKGERQRPGPASGIFAGIFAGAFAEAFAGAFAGAFVDGVHRFPLRVYYQDTDAGGIVYYANDLKFARRARSEMMHPLDAGYGNHAAADPTAFAVRRGEIDFLAPARRGDLRQAWQSLSPPNQRV